MRNFVTSFLSALALSLVLASGVGHAQSVAIVGHAQPVHGSRMVALAPSGRMDQGVAPYLEGKQPAYIPLAYTNDTLLYMDTTLGLYNWYRLPEDIGLAISSTKDTTDQIIAYGERFTAPTGNWYLDSVDMLLGATKFDDANGNGNRIIVQARTQQSRTNSDGSISYFANFGTNSIIDSNSIYPSDAPNDGSLAVLPGDGSANIIRTYFKKHKKVTNFFVTVAVMDTDETALYVRGDSVQGTTTQKIDNAKDRSYWFTNSYQNYMAGLSYGGGDPFFPNFFVVAYLTTDPSTHAAVATSSQPNGFALEQNYPNPFNPSTDIAYSVPATGNVLLTVSNLLGQKVATLVDHVEASGPHSVTFDATNLPSGTYYYTLNTGGYVQTRRMVLSK